MALTRRQRKHHFVSTDCTKTLSTPCVASCNATTNARCRNISSMPISGIASSVDVSPSFTLEDEANLIGYYFLLVIAVSGCYWLCLSWDRGTVKEICAKLWCIALAVAFIRFVVSNGSIILIYEESIVGVVCAIALASLIGYCFLVLVRRHRSEEQSSE